MSTTHVTKSRRAVAALALATAALGAVPLAGAAVLAATGTASAMPANGWCWEEVPQPNGTVKLVKAACD